VATAAQASSVTVSGTTLTQWSCPVAGMAQFRTPVSGGSTGTVTVSALTLPNVSQGGSGCMAVSEIDGSPTGCFAALKFSNGAVTDNGDGTGTITTGVGGGSVANPTGTIGLSAINGTATTAMRSDAAPPLSTAITPTWTGLHTFAGVTAIDTGKYLITGSPTETGASKFNLTNASYTNSGDTRSNQVYRLGANVGPDNLQTTTDAAVYDSWESHYAPDAQRYVERHISFSTAAPSTEVRLWSAAVNKATSVASISSTADVWQYYKRTDGSVFLYLNPVGQSFLNGKLDVGPGNTSASGFTFSVNGITTTTAVVKAGSAQSGNIFLVLKSDATSAFRVDSAYDVWSAGGLNAVSVNATGDSISSNFITAGYAMSMRNDGALTLRNSGSSAGIYFTSGTHEYDTKDTGMVRNAAGIVAITDGSAGVGSTSTYRDLKVRTLTTHATTLITTGVALSDGAAAQAATMTNAPAAGNPTKWIALNDNGTTRYIPAW